MLYSEFRKEKRESSFIWWSNELALFPAFREFAKIVGEEEREITYKGVVGGGTQNIYLLGSLARNVEIKEITFCDLSFVNLRAVLYDVWAIYESEDYEEYIEKKIDVCEIDFLGNAKPKENMEKFFKFCKENGFESDFLKDYLGDIDVENNYYISLGLTNDFGEKIREVWDPLKDLVEDIVKGKIPVKGIAGDIRKTEWSDFTYFSNIYDRFYNPEGYIYIPPTKWAVITSATGIKFAKNLLRREFQIDPAYVLAYAYLLELPEPNSGITYNAAEITHDITRGVIEKQVPFCILRKSIEEG